MQMQLLPASVKMPAKETKSEAGKLEWKQKKEEQAKARKRAADLKRAEEEIAEKEARQEKLENEMNDPKNATNSAKLSEIHEELVELSKDLERLYEIWEGLAQEE